MSNQINNATPAASIPPAEARTAEAPKQPENIDQTAGEFASLMKGKPKPKPTGAQSKTGDHVSANPGASGEAGHIAEASGQPRLQQADGQNQFADGRTAAMAREQSALQGADLQSDTVEGGALSHEKPQQSFGDSILQAFGGGQTQNQATPVEMNAGHGADVKATTAGETIAEVSQTIADKILVSDPAHGGDQEVRIMLKDSVLPGTEVRITQQGGEIQVQFHTDAADSHDLLSKHQAMLTERLNERLDKNVAVDIEFDSKGQGDQHGRSSQQRDLMEEMMEQQRQTKPT